MQVLTTAPWRWEEVNGRRARGTCSARRAPEGGLEGGARVRGGGGVLDGNQRRAQDRLLNALPIKRPAQVGFTLVVAPSWAQPYNLRHAPKPTGPRTCGERARRAEHLHAHVRDCDTRPSRPVLLPGTAALTAVSTSSTSGGSISPVSTSCTSNRAKCERIRQCVGIDQPSISGNFAR